MFSEWPRVLRLLAEAESISESAPHGEVVALLAAVTGLRVLILHKAKLAPMAIPKPKRDLLTCKEAAEDLKLNTETVRVLCRRHELPCIHIGRSLRIPREALEQFKRNRL